MSCSDWRDWCRSDVNRAAVLKDHANRPHCHAWVKDAVYVAFSINGKEATWRKTALTCARRSHDWRQIVLARKEEWCALMIIIGGAERWLLHIIDTLGHFSEVVMLGDTAEIPFREMHDVSGHRMANMKSEYESYYEPLTLFKEKM